VSDGHIGGQFAQDLFGFVMECEDAVVLVGVGADAAEVDDFPDAGLEDRFFVGGGPLGDLRHEVIVGVEEAAGGEQTIYGIGAGEGGGEEGGIFDIADGGGGAEGFDFFLFGGIAADDGYVVSFVD